jgi:hypothetical protein
LARQEAEKLLFIQGLTLFRSFSASTERRLFLRTMRYCTPDVDNLLLN